MGRKMYNSTIVVVIVLTAKEAEIVVYIRSKIMAFILFCCLSFFKIYGREREASLSSSATLTSCPLHPGSCKTEIRRPELNTDTRISLRVGDLSPWTTTAAYNHAH